MEPSVHPYCFFQHQEITCHMTEKEHQFVGDAGDTLKRTLTLPNDINTIPRLSEFIDNICEDLGVDMSVTMSLNLAMEEAVVNVMNYAYPVGTSGEVSITVVANERRIQFVIADSGKPFDPTAKDEVDTTLSAEDRPIGGLGIHLVRQIMDSVNYEYANDRNILTLCKLLAPNKE